MFDNIGWGEIFALFIVAVIIIGPERLPDVIKDVRAAAFAARRAVRNARAELDGVTGEFEELREPLSQATEWSRMGPRAAITKALFDGEDDYLDDFDPKKIMAETERGVKAEPKSSTPPQPTGEGSTSSSDLAAQQAEQLRHAQNQKPSARGHQTPPPATGEGKGDYGTGGGFSWADIT